VSNGWEYIPYLRKDTSLIQDEFAGVTHLEIIKDTYGGVFWPIYSINTIGIMCPGQGYQAKFNSTQLWHYSPNNIDSVLDYEGTKSFLYNLVPNNSDIITDNSMVVGIPENCWDQAPILGDIIEAISEQGDVVGRSYYNNGFTAIVIFGDDLSTSTIQEGLQEGETFSLRIVSGSGEKTRTPNINLKSWSVGDGNYEKDKISVLALKNESNLPQLSSFELESLSPNPNSGEFELKIVSKLECECMVSIYDIEGKNVFIENKTILEGENTMQFNFNKLRQGQYQLFIQDNNLKESIKFQILKK